jgi:hypothetical protein
MKRSTRMDSPDNTSMLIYDSENKDNWFKNFQDVYLCLYLEGNKNN